MKERGGQQTCVIGKDANGSCPAGLYFDELAGICAPPNGETSAPYGIDNAALASQTYAGCAAGYSYNENFQCCQAVTGGTYPGCAPGYTFSTDIGACTPPRCSLAVKDVSRACKCIEMQRTYNTCAQYNDSESRCVADAVLESKKRTSVMKP